MSEFFYPWDKDAPVEAMLPGGEIVDERSVYTDGVYDEMWNHAAAFECRWGILYPDYDSFIADRRREMREAAGMPNHAWACTACETPCSLTLVSEISRFMSACCTASIRPTKEKP